MDEKDLLLEVGTEEIPAAFLTDALKALREKVIKELQARRIAFKDIKTMGTPRRLALIASGVAVAQEELIATKLGPAKSIAFDKDGSPTKAAIGFAKGQGIDIADIKTVKTDKGEYICAEKKEQSELTIKLLPQILPDIILALPFRKSMRWGDLEVRFARPIHWIVALFGNTIVPFQLGNINSGDTSYGHRFMSPGPLRIAGAASYAAQLAQAFVFVDPQVRRDTLIREIRSIAASVNGVPDEDSALIDEVTNLIENCSPVLCHFENEFLQLPREVLITTMKKHQKYFPILDTQGSPLPCFIAVNNTRAREPAVSARGHERVLRARLSDARFFYTADQKKSLDAMTERLQGVIFQAQLGTSFEKVQRFQELALFITDKLSKPSIRAKVERAAYLCKADLVSEMVGEFPELQGVMGREYARIAGEDADVAEAIFEHYLPRFAEDDIPSSDIGAIVGMADKLDTIAGCFGVGLIPTGTADPYALRRQCLGIINIIAGRQYKISLTETIHKAIALLKEKLTRPVAEVSNDVLNFFSVRFSNLLTSQGYPADAVDAVVSCGIDDVLDMQRRIEALQQVKQVPDFEALAIAFKRVVNILAGAVSGAVSPGLFEEQAERDLHQKYLSLCGQVQSLMHKKEYLPALKLIATLRTEVDNFFDKVMVMVEQEAIRTNRLALLQEVSSLFVNFADFTKLSSA
ncbi:MAG: glycine--tRNA ligase subunit beta [Proteobacteria bacterium]|nr:glycine--tRNA ligase subunit beta [Pseudomonadota bacterium]